MNCVKKLNLLHIDLRNIVKTLNEVNISCDS